MKSVKQTTNHIIAVFALLIVIGVLPMAAFAATFSAQKVLPIIFPVLGSANYSNDWHAPRAGHLHQGNDIFGYKGQPLVSTVDGTVRFVPYPQPSYGYMISIEDAEGYEYWYLHINNDNPGTDDGQGGGMHAYAPGMESGAHVKAGQIIGWMGDSGNAEGTRSHLHFELHEPDGDAINPFFSLQAARRITQAVAPAPQANEIFPFGSFTGGGSVTLGDIDTAVDGLEIVTGAGAGGGPSVAVYNGSTKIASFFAYPRSFRGGVDVATGDLDGDGNDEIITAAGRGGASEVHIYDTPGVLTKIFFPYPKFSGEVRIAAADLDGDGVDEIVTAPGRGGGPDVKVFYADGSYKNHFFTYAKSFRGGIDVAATDATEFESGRIITGPMAGGGPHMKVFTPTGELTNQFFAYRKEFRGGVRVSTGLSFGEPRIITVPAGNDDADIHVYQLDGTLEDTHSEYEEWWRGGFDVAGGTSGTIYVSTLASSRRTSVRLVQERRNWYDDETFDATGLLTTATN